jgi:DNA-binding MarR family transcriptional regulator
MTASQAIAKIITQDCLGGRVRLLNRKVSRIYDDAFRPLGIKVTQLNLLVVIIRLAPCYPAQLIRVLDIKKSTLSRNIERLRKQGLLDVQREVNGRRQRLSVTPKGHDLLQQALPRWQEAQRQTEAMLGATTSDALRCLPTAIWSESSLLS